jgi:hypothetical protein
VRVAVDRDQIEIARLPWRKSSHSSGHGECVEVAGAPGFIALRDSKAPVDRPLMITAADWAALLNQIKTQAL